MQQDVQKVSAGVPGPEDGGWDQVNGRLKAGMRMKRPPEAYSLAQKTRAPCVEENQMACVYNHILSWIRLRS